MKKNIALLISVEPPGSPLYIRRIVETAMKHAAYPGQLQFIFAVDETDKVCLDEVHKLYTEHAPGLFDPFPVATIKIVNKSKSVYSDLLEKAEAPFVIDLEPIVYFTEKNWDKTILDDFDKYKKHPEHKISGLYYQMDSFKIAVHRKESKMEDELKTA